MSLARKVSTADLSIALGITPRAVAKLTDRKVLRREARGCYDLVDAIAAYIAHREATVARAHGLGTYGKARTQLYLERARMARLKREEVEGALVPADEMLAGMSAIFAVVRNRVLAVGPKTAPRLTLLKYPAEAQSIVDAECREALEALSTMEIRVKRKGRRLPAKGIGDEAAA